MAAHPGEENIANLFADVHYFYGDPTAIPPHHRFDKGSYVYLFENANDRRARLEIANQPGTEHQDAFWGFLDSTRIQYSYKHSCIVTIVVGEVQRTEEWHLPTFDPTNQKKYHYKLHSLDIYFWTQNDALQFVNGTRRVLPPAQVDVQDEPSPPPVLSNQMSPVVQKLEQAAISNQQQQHPMVATTITSQQSLGAHTFAPPPISTVSGSGVETSASFTPMAYNPAAPAAPESLKPREKTPPPEDGGVNPLHVAVVQDQMLSPSFAPQIYGMHQGAIPGPPSQPPPGVVGMTSPGIPKPQALQSPGFAPVGYGSTPIHLGPARASTIPAHAALPSPGLASPYGSVFPGSPGLPPPPPTQPPVINAQTVAHAPAPDLAPAPTVATPPPGGYVTYKYADTSGAGGSNTSTPSVAPVAPSTSARADYVVHQHAYKPMQEELKYSEIAGNGYERKEKGKKLEENAGRLERGVTGMLKRFEKKFG